MAELVDASDLIFECSVRNNRSRISLIKQLNEVETPAKPILDFGKWTYAE